MNRGISLLYSILIIAPLLSADGKYLVDTKESVIIWKGCMQYVANYIHFGYLSLSDGRLTFEGDQLAGGSFEVDMNTMLDEKHESSNDLIRHLKSTDFFDVEKFPVSTFTITQIASMSRDSVKVAGDLTIKGIKQAVTFPAKVEVANNVVNARGKLIIDRTKWDVRYNSGKFFSNLADETISDNIELDVKIVAKRDSSNGPRTMVRNLIQDSKGNIWLAAWKDVFRYDGKTFNNITGKTSSGNYWTVLEDRKGNFWFGTIGSGVYFYDGKSFRNFTTKNGLVNNEVSFIYEDRSGNIWLGANGGMTCYDGRSFRNYMIEGGSINEARTGKVLPDKRPPDEITAIVQDKSGRLWFAARSNTFVYDGKTFAVFRREGRGFSNVRSVIEDKSGNIWLGGADGLWRYDGKAFKNVTTDFVAYIYEDKKGNIWTTSGMTQVSMLSRYDENSLSNEKPTVTVVKSQQGMLCGIIEDNDGNIWVGAGDGVWRWDGKGFEDFKK